MRRLLLLPILLLAGLQAGAQTLDRAFDEALNTRAFVAQTRATVQRYCAGVRGASAEEEIACAWPKSVDAALAQLDTYDMGGPFARTARLRGGGRGLADRLIEGTERETAELASLLTYLQNGRALTTQAAALLKTLGSTPWKLARALEGDTNTNVADDVRDLTAWLSSDNPLGFLRRAASLDPASAPAFERAVACLTPPDVRATIASPAGLLVRERLAFQEVDVKRSAWGETVAGMVTTTGALEHPLEALRDLQSRTENLDLSGLGSELDKCRALSRVQQALDKEDSTIEPTRLECDLAQREGRALPARADGRLAFGQKALLLLESRRARGVESLRRSRAAAIYRDLVLPPETTCDGDPRWRPVLVDLKRFINNESLED